MLRNTAIVLAVQAAVLLAGAGQASAGLRFDSVQLTVAPLAAPPQNAPGIPATASYTANATCDANDDCTHQYTLRMLPVEVSCQQALRYPAAWQSEVLPWQPAPQPATLPATQNIAWTIPPSGFGKQHRVCLIVTVIPWNSSGVVADRTITAPAAARKIILTAAIAKRVAVRYAQKRNIPTSRIACSERAEELFRCTILYDRDGKLRRIRVLISHEGTKFVVRRVRS